VRFRKVKVTLSKTITFLLFGVAAISLGGRAVQAQTTFSSWQLQGNNTNIKLVDDEAGRGSLLQSGVVTLLHIEGGPAGGNVQLERKLPGGGGCHVKYGWTFQPAAPTLTINQKVNLAFEIIEDSPATCGEVWMFTTAWSISIDAPPAAGNSESRCYNTPAAGVSNVCLRTFWIPNVDYQQAPVLNIYMMGFADCHVVIPYWGIPSAPAVQPPSSAPTQNQQIQMMTKWASQYPGFFGAANPTTFGQNPNWLPQWSESWVSFNLKTGGSTWVVLATNKANPATQVIEYYNPATAAWVSWFTP